MLCYGNVEGAGTVHRDVLLCVTLRKLKQLKKISKDITYFVSFLKTTERCTVCGSESTFGIHQLTVLRRLNNISL